MFSVYLSREKTRKKAACGLVFPSIVKKVFEHMIDIAKDHAAPSLVALAQARKLIGLLDPIGREVLSITNALHRISVEDIVALSSCPSIHSSLKDGFAVRASDVADARPDRPVFLQEVGVVTAGGHTAIKLEKGQTIRIMTGAPVPDGADAVLASEFAMRHGDMVQALRDAHVGRNILPCGSDVAAGKIIVRRGTKLFPSHLGLLAAAGVSKVSVFQQPKVMVIATGSELAAPGESIAPGQVAASNLVTLMAELHCMGIAVDHLLIRDNLHQLQENIAPLIGRYDVILTCGGVLDGDKDFTMQAMRNLEVEPVFNRVRVGPGKGVCLGHKGGAFFFNLPGGPPSNHVAFVLLAKPGIFRLAGVSDPFAEYVSARLVRTLTAQQGWTQMFYGLLGNDGGGLTVEQLTCSSRLQVMAEADCLIELPEDQACAESGTIIRKIWKIR